MRKSAIANHDYAIKSYNALYEIVTSEISGLYNERKEAIKLIQFADEVINSLANTPLEFETKTGEIKRQLADFTETEEAAQAYYENLKDAGVNMIAGAGLGLGVASMGPNILMSIATTFGKAATGTAIKELSGIAAKKAAVAWIGRFFAKFAITKGAGMAVGNAILTVVGPIGWGISAISIGSSLLSLSNKNKKKAEELNKETKEILGLKNRLTVMKGKVEGLALRTRTVCIEIEESKETLRKYINSDFSALSNSAKGDLATLINNAHTLSVLLNETIRDNEVE